MSDTLFPCDPEKNTECNKRGCFINGGPCSKTRKLAFAKQPLTTVTMVFEASEEDAAMFTEKDVNEHGKQEANPCHGKKNKSRSKRG
jgi:hypothetical protein